MDDEVVTTMRAWLEAERSAHAMVDAFFEDGPGRVTLTAERARDVDAAFAELERLHEAYREACRRRWG